MPYAYQEDSEVRARYDQEEGYVGYKIGRRKKDQILIIDPSIFLAHIRELLGQLWLYGYFDDNGNAFGNRLSYYARSGRYCI